MHVPSGPLRDLHNSCEYFLARDSLVKEGCVGDMSQALTVSVDWKGRSDSFPHVLQLI